MNLDKIQVPNNWVCVRYDNSNEYIKIGESQIMIDTTFEPEKNAQTTGTVIKVCDHLTFNPSSSTSHPYDVDIEVKAGDQVIFHFLTIRQAQKEGKTFIQDGKLYVFMPYDRLFVAINQKGVTPLNGFVIIKPHDEELPKTIFEIPDIAKKISKKIGTVLYAGSKCRGYAEHHLRDLGEDPDVEVGDTVIFNPIDAIPLQYEYQSVLEKGLYRMQRKDILMTTFHG